MVFAGMLMILNRDVVGEIIEPFTGTLAFHYGSFDNVYGDGTVAAAADNGHIYDDTPTGTYSWGSLDSRSTASDQTTYTWTPPQAITADVLLVAGGGGSATNNGGGGGAGGLLHYTNQSIDASTKTVVVGNGGTPGSGFTSTGTFAEPGKNTSFTGLVTAVGGGAGTQYTNNLNSGNRRNGGSGGGAAGSGSTSTYHNGGSGTSGQGNNGGRGIRYAGGGGGGAGGRGRDGISPYTSGGGGIGLDKSSVFGTTYGDSGWFAGGGSGGSRIAGVGGRGGGGDGGGIGVPGEDGQAHTGGGGGGSKDSAPAANGGSGIVLVRFIEPLLHDPNDSATFPTITSSPNRSTNNISYLLYPIQTTGDSTTLDVFEDVSGSTAAVSWVKLEYDSIKYMSSVSLQCPSRSTVPNAFPQNCEIFTSTDDVNYVSQGTLSMLANFPNVYSLDFDLVAAKYIQVTMMNNNREGLARFHVFGRS